MSWSNLQPSSTYIWIFLFDSLFQILQVEEELRKELEEKNKQILSSAQEKHNRALQTMEEEKSVLEQTVKDLQTKVFFFFSVHFRQPGSVHGQIFF